MEIPSEPDISRVLQPQRAGSLMGTLKVLKELFIYWDMLKLPLQKPAPGASGPKGLWHGFTPGTASLGLTHVSGPLGRGLWNRLLDLVAIAARP